MIIRKNTITYSPANKNIPEIKLQNRFIEKAGFNVGDKIKVTYMENTIIIEKDFSEKVEDKEQLRIF